MSYRSAVSSVVESLERRTLLASTPADPRPETLGRSFDLDERAALLSRLNMINRSTYLALKADLDGGHTSTFDTRLLDYMRSRTTANYFFDDSQAGAIAAWTEANSSPDFQITNASDVTDRHLFPEQSSVDSYTIPLPADVNWNDSTPSDNPEFLPALNRMDWWVDLAQSYRYTGQSKYLDEMEYELADWSYENPTFREPAKASSAVSYAFTMGIRVENWLMAYFSVLGSSGWTGADNSLMLYKLAQQADVLARVGGNLTDFANNRSVSIGRAEMYLGVLFPEMDNAAAWSAAGRQTLYNSIGSQFYPDGSHREHSPGYAVLTIDQLLEAKRLDALNDVDWSADKDATLTNAVDALWQQLSPDANRPAIGDTYRMGATTIFLKAALTLGQTRWPEAKPRPRDAWLFGTTAVDPYKAYPVSPAVGSRGDTYTMEDSGNYILRSGSDADARQINFDAGPKGGAHGHYDLLNFELFGYGRPLIADPGAYVYDTSAARQWVISTKAHNTVGVADLNHGELETLADIRSSGIQNVAGGYMISAGHQGYFFQDGAPTVSRSVWYDGGNTMVVVDFVEATRAQNWEQSFIVQNQNTSRDLGNGLIYTKNSTGGNVRIQSLLRPGQAAYAQTSGVFTTSDPPPNATDPATRYYVQQLGTTYAVFATLITTHNGNTANAAISSASWVSVPHTFGDSAVLKVNGTNITFSPPEWQRLNAQAESRGTFNDVAYDSKGRLHMVFYDRDQRNLKYAVRDTNGVWSTVEVIDNDDYCGYTPSLAIDKYDRPGVAYQDAWNGDLRYAYLSPITNAWDVQTVDVPGSTGGYPSLVMSRNNTPVIAYYNKTKGDLRMALQDTNGWLIQTIDSKGDVGRFPSIQLDPNRPTASKFAVAYEDTGNFDMKYAIQYKTGWAYSVMDNTTPIAGGYTSLQFFDSGASSDRYKPVATYYDAGNGRLKYAYNTGSPGDADWSNLVIASRKRQGLYSKLFIENNKPRVFFFDGTTNKAMFLSSTKVIGGSWALSVLGDGGRDIHFAYRNGVYDFTGLDEATGTLSVNRL